MKNFNVIFFKKNDGSCPVEDFLDSIDKKMKIKLTKEISLLQEYGNMVREPYSKHLHRVMILAEFCIFSMLGVKLF